MGHYEHKTKEELLEIVCKLEKKVEGLFRTRLSEKGDSVNGTVLGF